MKTFAELYEMSDRLWEEAKLLGFQCIENHLTDGENLKDYPYCLSSSDFELTKDKQSVIFADNNGKTYVIRTTYSIKAEKDGFTIKGIYSLDYNGEDEIIDDWLIID